MFQNIFEYLLHYSTICTPQQGNNGRPISWHPKKMSDKENFIRLLLCAFLRNVSSTLTILTPVLLSCREQHPRSQWVHMTQSRMKRRGPGRKGISCFATSQDKASNEKQILYSPYPPWPDISLAAQCVTHFFLDITAIFISATTETNNFPHGIAWNNLLKPQCVRTTIFIIPQELADLARKDITLALYILPLETSSAFSFYVCIFTHLKNKNKLLPLS